MRPVTRLAYLFCLIMMFCLAFPTECPAPLVWRKGEGWTYEREGVTTAGTPREQLELARQLQQKGQYDPAIGAYRRLLARWPTAAAAQDARLGLAECLTELGYLYKAFKEYQNLIEKHPNSPHFATALERQFEIGNRFLAGERHRIWRLRIFGGLDKALEVFEQVVKNGPYSPVGPRAQFNIGQVYEKQRDYISAVRAYEKILERYPRLPIVEEAQFQIGWAYLKEARRSEYDQNNANQAIAAFSDFLLRFPDSEKAPQAEELRASLKQEQSRGLFQIAHFYEKRRNFKAALIYYNEVIEQNPRSEWAGQAQQKILALAARQREAAGTVQ